MKNNVEFKNGQSIEFDTTNTDNIPQGFSCNHIIVDDMNEDNINILKKFYYERIYMDNSPNFEALPVDILATLINTFSFYLYKKEYIKKRDRYLSRDWIGINKIIKR